MKLITKLVPDKELTITVEYPAETPHVRGIIDRLKSEEDYLIGKDEGRECKIPIFEIMYLENLERKTFVYTKEQIYSMNQPLYTLEKKLKDYGFVRVSKSCIINVRELIHLENIANSKFLAYLRNGEKVIVSRTYIADIRECVYKEKVL